MAVVYKKKIETGKEIFFLFFLDQEKFLNEGLFPFKCKENLFKKESRKEKNFEKEKKLRTKKEKRTEEDIRRENVHKNIETLLEIALEDLGTFIRETLKKNKKNEKNFQELPRKEESQSFLENTVGISEFEDLVSRFPKPVENVDLDANSQLDIYNLFDCVSEVVAFNRSFLIPPNSSFLMSSFKNIHQLLKNKNKDRYSLIVIDPPWENKSVLRAKKYSSLSPFLLTKIPLRKLTNTTSVVFVWCTNKIKYQDFIKEILFPSWSFKVVGIWYWLKFTNDGDLVFPLNSKHKKPYEPVFVGVPIRNNKHKLPERLMFGSVASVIHSQKPCLESFLSLVDSQSFQSIDILHFFVESSNSKNLELFSRNLLTNWMSWGNETLRFNDKKLYSLK